MNIGFYILDIDMSPEHTKVLKAINELCVKRPQDHIVVFNNQFTAIDPEQKYYVLHINQAKFFRGLLFVFSTKAALLTSTFPCSSKQILYMNKPEWAEHPELPYTVWSNIYMHTDIELLTDDQTTHDLCKICWKTPLPLINVFDGEALNNVIQRI